MGECAHWQALRKCWDDCKKGARPEQAGGDTYTRCTDPRVCHGWRDYTKDKEGI
jgi:hypothetical protein